MLDNFYYRMNYNIINTSANTMQNISGLGNGMTTTASNIVRSGLTKNCKEKCPPNSAFER